MHYIVEHVEFGNKKIVFAGNFSAQSAAEAHRTLKLNGTKCRALFRRLQKNDFEVEDKERSDASKKFQDEKL